jgi:hypothetical protein
LFRFEPGVHTLRLVCVGANPASRHLQTGQPGYNLSADVLSLRRLPFDNFDEWIERAVQREQGE